MLSFLITSDKLFPYQNWYKLSFLIADQDQEKIHPRVQATHKAIHGNPVGCFRQQTREFQYMLKQDPKQKRDELASNSHKSGNRRVLKRLQKSSRKSSARANVLITPFSITPFKISPKTSYYSSCISSMCSLGEQY